MKRLSQSLLGLLASLVLLEGAFWINDQGAFPHVNVYEADAVLGARLQAGVSQAIVFSDNPVSTFRTNALGFRGEDWPAQPKDAILVIGDSQVFGLGVNDTETASAVLARLAHRPVLNAGTPTWGPGEYLEVTRRILDSHKPTTVVLVINAANDFFERDRPNVDRHTVWDGWAVRKETAPTSVVAFPGRQWVYSKSHLVYNLRRALAPEDPQLEVGFTSEGSPLDLARLPKPPVERRSESEVAEKVAAVADELRDAEQRVEWLLESVFPDLSEEQRLAMQGAVQHAHPGDIVSDRYAEGGRSIVVTAEALREGAKLRREAPARLVAWAQANPTRPEAKEILEHAAEVRRNQAELEALGTVVGSEAPQPSPLADYLAQLHAVVRAGGADLVVVALPVDVMVSPEEWAKYGYDPGDPKLDMSATTGLLTDLVSDAERLGVRGLDVTDALRAGLPGVFLYGDIHLTAKGQAIVAKAIAERLAAPAPPPTPRPGLPEGRSRVPTVAELELAPEIVVKGSTRNHCSTRQVREWLYVNCDVPWRVKPTVAWTGSLETMTTPGNSGVEILTPLLEGRGFDATVSWPKVADPTETRDVPWQTGRTAKLTVRWGEDQRPELRFEDVDTGSKMAVTSTFCSEKNSYVLGTFHRGCESLFVPDETPWRACEAVVACARGSRNPLPACGEGQVNAGSAGHCFATCVSGTCEEGTCIDWQGAPVCL